MTELLIAWLPLILLLVVFGLFVSRQQKKYEQHVEEVNAVNREIVTTNREIIAKLEEIRVLLDKKAD